MPTLRQLPLLLIRGNLANVTMAEMSDTQKEEVNEIVKYVLDHPMIKAKRNIIRREYASTIGADYRDDPSAADQEFDIAVWRAVVTINCHHKYQFKCSICGSIHWITGRGAPKPIQRRSEFCPNCKKTIIDDPGSSDFEAGQIVHKSEFDAVCDSIGYVVINEHGWVGRNLPTCKSPIEKIVGDKAYQNPRAIIEDEKQLSKFFGEYVWNYLRQQLAENKRARHNRRVSRITSHADEVIAIMIADMCKRLGIKHTVVMSDRNDTVLCTIYTPMLATPPEFCVELNKIIEQANSHDVTVLVKNDRIEVLQSHSAPIISCTVTESDVVRFCEEGDGETNIWSIDNVPTKSNGVGQMDYDSHVAYVEMTEFMDTVRESLPDEKGKMVFDVDTQTGQYYDEFCDRFGDIIPSKTKICKFVNISMKQLDEYRDIIRCLCLMHGFEP